MSEERQIKVDAWAKPIPLRDWDYIAYRDGDEEEGLRGNGATQEAAIDDLLSQEADNE